MGHLKQRTVKEQLVKDPSEVLRKAVLRMLPRNRLRDVSSHDKFESVSLVEQISDVFLLAQ